MKQTHDKRTAKRSVRRQRGRRLATGVNVCVALLLAVVLTGMLNYLAARHYVRRDISRSDYFKLSEKTKGLIAGLESDVRIIAFFRENHFLHDSVQKLLREYRYEAGKSSPRRLTIQLVDPNRDLVPARALKQEFNLVEADTLLIECEGRVKHIGEKQLADQEIEISETGALRKWTGFKGEQAISSGIQSVVQSSRPIVYFLGGHGERSVTDFSKQAGYSTIGRVLERDNIEVRPLLLTANSEVPADCAALIVAGARRSLSRAERDMLAQYLTTGGRAAILIDPGTQTGLDAFLREWGIELHPDVVVDPTRTLTGRELVVAEYGNHPVTRQLQNVTTVFYLPRSVRPAAVSGEAGSRATDDRPHVVALASCTDQGWADVHVRQRPRRFDAGEDTRGPLPVAVAVEKGTVSGIDVAMKPTRLVVVGDSSFISNAALNTGVGGNIDFFMSLINWLVERESLLAIGPKAPGELVLDMTRRQLRLAYLVSAGGVPAGIALIGLLVWLRRRR